MARRVVRLFWIVVIAFAAPAFGQTKPPLKLTPATVKAAPSHKLSPLWDELVAAVGSGDYQRRKRAAVDLWMAITNGQPQFPASIVRLSKLDDGRVAFVAAGWCQMDAPHAVGDDQLAIMSEPKPVRRQRRTFRGIETFTDYQRINIVTDADATIFIENPEVLRSMVPTRLRFGLAWIGIGIEMDPESKDSLTVVALYMFCRSFYPPDFVEAERQQYLRAMKSGQRKAAESARRARHQTAVTASLAPGVGPDGKLSPGWFKITASNSDRERTDAFTVEILSGSDVIHRHPFKPLAPGGSKYVTLDLRGKPAPTSCRVVWRNN